MVKLVVATLAALSAFGQQDAESMHVNNVRLTLSKRATVLIHTRLRTRQAYQECFQARIGPVVNFEISRRATLIGGYYFIAQHYPALKTSQWVDYNRYFGGASVRLVNRGEWKVDWRNLIERFQDTPGRDYTRVRTRGGVGRTWRDWTATATMEGLFAQSRATVRVGAAVDKRLNRELITGIGYELRQYPDHSVGHIVITNITWQPGNKQ